MTERLGEVLGAVAAPLTEPDSRTYLPFLAIALAVGVVLHLGRRGSLRDLPRALGLPAFRHRSAWLDLELLAARRLLGLLWAGPRLGMDWLVGTTLALALDRLVGVPDVPQVPGLVLSAGYTLALFVAWDASRYALHRLMHEAPLLWQFHQVHHSAEVLTPFTFHRVHPVESALYDVRGALVGGTLAGVAFWLFRGAAVEWTVLGVHAVGLALDAVSGNLRHSHVWWSFGARVERWLISPAQHQLHHAVDGDRANYGTWLACWDRLAGSLVLAPSAPPAAYGLPPDARNHRDDLPSALLGPVLAALALVARVARAQEPAEEEVPDYEIVVVRPDGVPRVAGSAHVVTEEELRRFGYGDVTKPLQKVPGVYVRGEDGFGLRPNIGMRGGNSDRSAKIALLQDGIPLSPAPYAAPAAYYFPLTTRLVGIEVFKGPASIRYGPQTIGGAVNVLTRDVPPGPAAALDTAVGMYDTVKLHGWTGTGGPRMGVLVEGAHLSSGGFKELDTGGPTGFVRQDVMAKALGVVAGDVEHVVELALGYGREASDETYLGLTLADAERTPYRRYAASALDHMAWDHTEASLSWTLASGPFSLRTVAYHHWLARAWTKLNGFAAGPDLHDLLLSPASGQGEVFLGILKGEVDGTTEDQELRIGTNDRTFRNGGVQVAARHEASRGAFGTDLEVGARVHVDDVTRLHTEDPYAMVSGFPVRVDGPTETTLDSRTRAEALAAWVAEDLTFGPLHVLPGLRAEVIRTSAGTSRTGPVDPVTRTIGLPGAGLFLEARPWLDAFAGLHRGFSPAPPDADEDAVPEVAWSTEGGLRAHGGETHAEVVGFFSDYQNLTGQCTLSSGCTEEQLDQQFDGGRAWVAGLEALGAHRVGLPGRVGLAGSASYTLTRSSFRTAFVSEYPQFGAIEVGDALPYVPEHQGAVTVSADNPRGEVALTATGRSAMRDVAGQGEIPRAERIPGSLVLDASVHAHATEHVSAYLTATNVTDAVVIESFRPYGARPGAPFTLVGGVEVR